MENTINLQTERQSYELFRRAILERDLDAWNKIYVIYRASIRLWIDRYVAAWFDGDMSYITDLAFARSWMALSCDSTSLQLMSAFLISGKNEDHYEPPTERDFPQTVAHLFASIDKWNSNLNQWRSELYGPRSGYAC